MVLLDYSEYYSTTTVANAATKKTREIGRTDRFKGEKSASCGSYRPYSSILQGILHGKHGL
jgi:hypothetical protein